MQEGGGFLLTLARGSRRRSAPSRSGRVGSRVIVGRAELAVIVDLCRAVGLPSWQLGRRGRRGGRARGADSRGWLAVRQQDHAGHASGNFSAQLGTPGVEPATRLDAHAEVTHAGVIGPAFEGIGEGRAAAAKAVHGDTCDM